MGAETYIVIGVILAAVGLAVWYIVKEKKKGAKCIGCPYSKQCSGNCGEQKENQ
ncbi:MAG: FeoB-associated Cys-rich membrane protein [Clostridia bacterium]|nr:FeoB-associated Cys-rich membrane protein [Clostridia bacterium]